MSFSINLSATANGAIRPIEAGAYVCTFKGIVQNRKDGTPLEYPYFSFRTEDNRQINIFIRSQKSLNFHVSAMNEQYKVYDSCDLATWLDLMTGRRFAVYASDSYREDGTRYDQCTYALRKPAGWDLIHDDVVVPTVASEPVDDLAGLDFSLAF